MFGNSKKKMPVGNPVKNQQITKQSLEDLAKCGNCGCADCPCPHYVLGELAGDKDNRIYLWNDGGTFTTGTKDDFLAACDAAKMA